MCTNSDGVAFGAALADVRVGADAAVGTAVGTATGVGTAVGMGAAVMTGVGTMQGVRTAVGVGAVAADGGGAVVAVGAATTGGTDAVFATVCKRRRGSGLGERVRSMTTSSAAIVGRAPAGAGRRAPSSASARLRFAPRGVSGEPALVGGVVASSIGDGERDAEPSEVSALSGESVSATGGAAVVSTRRRVLRLVAGAAEDDACAVVAEDVDRSGRLDLALDVAAALVEALAAGVIDDRTRTVRALTVTPEPEGF